MRERQVRLFCDEFLQRGYCCLKVVGIDIPLRFVEKIIKRIRYLLLPGLRFPFRFGIRLRYQHGCAAIAERSLCDERNDQEERRGVRHDASAQLKMPHGSMPGTPAPFGVLAGWPADLDAPFPARFAWPFALSARDKNR